jgi:hypothetical protein
MEWQRRLDLRGNGTLKALSVGEQASCEFGFAQRRFSVKPFKLERRAGIGPAASGPGEIETFSFVPLPSLRTVAIFAPTTYGQRRGPR